MLWRLGFTTIVVSISIIGSAFAQQDFGRFRGEVVAKFLPDGRNMKLVEPFAYEDPRRRTWDVPAGAETDGASIPRVLWSVYAPFTGKYRDAAVVHDYYCQTKSRGWQETHEAFYNAMRAAGVDEKTAKTMYGAVYSFGPRWGGTARTSRGLSKATKGEMQPNDLKALEEWIGKENPSLEQLTQRLDNKLSPR